MLYARKDEIITCERGHRIGVFNRDVDSQSTAKADSIDWDISPAPRNGDPITLCQCGAEYVHALRLGKVVAHIGDGWRAVTPEAISAVIASGRPLSKVPPE